MNKVKDLPYGDIILNSLAGLNYIPNPFPKSIWNTEFDGTSVEIFTEAIRRIRKTQSNFPTYSEVHSEINRIIVDRSKDSQSYYCKPLTEKEVELSRKARAVFRKWHKWLYSHDKMTPEILEKYYDGCARDYSKIGLGTTGMENVEELFLEADKQKKKIESVKKG